jgi:hypothetical protein
MSTPATRLGTGRAMVLGRNVSKRGVRADQQEVPLKPGQVRCEVCGKGVPLRESDGAMRAHQGRPGVSCPGAAVRPTYPGGDRLCEHGEGPGDWGKRCPCTSAHEQARQRRYAERRRQCLQWFTGEDGYGHLCLRLDLHDGGHGRAPDETEKTP